MIRAIGRLSAAKRNVTPSDSHVVGSLKSRCQLLRPTRASGFSWARLMLVNVKMNDATIGSNVNARKPMIQGAMKM